MLSKLRAYALNMELKNKLIILFLVIAVIPLGVLGTFSYYKSSSVIQEKVCQTILENLSQVNYSINYFVRDIEQLSMYIYANAEIQEVLSKPADRSMEEKYEDEKRVGKILEAFLGFKNWDIEIYILGANGDRYFTGDLLPDPYSEYNENWGLFRKARLAGGNVVWDTHYSMKKIDDFGAVLSSGRMLKNIATNRPLGYLVIDIMEQALADKYNKAHLYPGGQIYLLDRNGYVISSMPSKQPIGTKLNESYLSKVLEGKSGFFQVGGGNRADMVIYDTSEATGFKLISVVPVGEVTRESLSIRNLTLFIMVLGIFISYWLAYMLSINVTHPLRKLRSLMRLVENGNLDVSFVSKTKDEVGQLGQSFNTMVTQIKLLINEVYEKQLKVREAELKAVQAQFNPHFLYNALDSINWMARLHNIDEISRTVVSLGELLRFSIRKGKTFIQIGEDIQQIKNYLTIQKIRYGDKFEVVLDIDPDIEPLYTLKLLLQPLVENAIIHGLEPKQGKGTLRITGRKADGRVRFIVQDDGVGFDCGGPICGEGAMRSDNTGLGLENLRKRLELYFGGEASLEIESVPGEGTTVQLEIPWMTSAGDDHVQGADR